MAITLAILSFLAVLLPLIVKAYYGRKLDGEKARRVLLDRDIERLRSDLNKLRPGKTPPPLP